MKTSVSTLKILCSIFGIQVLLTILFLLRIFNSEIVHPNGKDFDYIPEENADLKAFDLGIEGEIIPLNQKKLEVGKKSLPHSVNIYSKASIGAYLWQHIIQAQQILNDQYSGILKGNWIHRNFNFSYWEEPGIDFGRTFDTQSTLVLILNGRTLEEVSGAIKWITQFPNSNIVVMLHGNEKCDNGWIKEYMHPKGPIIGGFLVHDDLLIDEDLFYQWPLGVSMYHRFSSLSDEQIRLKEPRKYTCNVLLTNRNSNFSQLFEFLRSDPKVLNSCMILDRDERDPDESSKPMDHYVLSLIQSDLTLCPSGLNMETHRLYEAMEAGSIPIVVEEIMESQCDQTSSLRLLKQFSAPMIWMKTWRDLPRILATERRLNTHQKVERRIKLRNWYQWFKQRMKFRFVSFFDKQIWEPD